jgi:hypothetical protein
MPILVLDLLKYAFLAVLYIFIARAVKAVYVELRGPAPARREPRSAPVPAPSRPPSRRRPSRWETSSLSDAPRNAIWCLTTRTYRRCTRAYFLRTTD